MWLSLMAMLPGIPKTMKILTMEINDCGKGQNKAQKAGMESEVIDY